VLLQSKKREARSSKSCGSCESVNQTIVKPVVKAQVKVVETPEQKKAREAQAAQLKATEEAARRKAAEEAQQRTLEQMRQMASKYSNEDATATIRVSG
jgi:translation initiation factor IF-2